MILGEFKKLIKSRKYEIICLFDFILLIFCFLIIFWLGKGIGIPDPIQKAGGNNLGSRKNLVTDEEDEPLNIIQRILVELSEE